MTNRKKSPGREGMNGFICDILGVSQPALLYGDLASTIKMGGERYLSDNMMP